MKHDRLSDYEIAMNFGDTLQVIYKEKMEELNNDLTEAYAHIDRLKIPQVPELHRYFAMEGMPDHIKERFQAVKHIQTIRGIYKKIKSGKEFLNVEQARNVPIKKVYDFKFKGKNVSCPLHEDNHPSASIKFNRLICFSCGAKMDSIALFQKINNVGFKEAVEALNKN